MAGLEEYRDLLDDPRLWVALAFVIFIAFAWKKFMPMFLNALDKRSARIKNELDEARRLREEAENVLNEYKRKQSEYLKEAEVILQDARRDADALRAYTEKELRAALETRMKHAVERISQEEGKAIADVRNHVVDIALAAARSLIVDHLNAMPQDDLVKLALADIERKIH